MQAGAVLRNRCIARGMRESRGFTLLELMVVVVVLTIVTLATFTGVHRDTFEARYRVFTDDLHGLVVHARNLSIDSATVSELRIGRDTVEYVWVDPISGVWRPGMTLRIDQESSVLGEHACVAGVYDGIQAPGMPAVLTALPGACMENGSVLRFMSDGSFDYPAARVGGAGVTLVIGDFRQKTSPTFTLLEIYPSGMVRKLENVKESK